MASPPAPRPLPGAALHQAGRLGVHRAVCDGSQPHAPVRWVPCRSARTSRQPRSQRPHACPRGCHWAGRNSPRAPACPWPADTPASVPQETGTSCRTRMPTVPCRQVSLGRWSPGKCALCLGCCKEPAGAAPPLPCPLPCSVSPAGGFAGTGGRERGPRRLGRRGGPDICADISALVGGTLGL